MDMRRRREILAAGHQGYALDCVVDRDREVIARRELFAGEHYIPKQRRVGLPSALSFDPVEWAGQRERACQIEPPCIIGPRTQLCGDLFGAAPAAGAGISRSGIAMRRAAGARDLGLDLAPRAKAGVEHT